MGEMKKDFDYLEKVQKAIVEKYGEKTIQDPKDSWNLIKEKKYLEYLSKFLKEKDNVPPNEDKVEVDGVLIPKKLFMKESDRVCASCSKYSFSIKDDLYMNKFRCCFDCYIQFVEGREQKWLMKLKEKE